MLREVMDRVDAVRQVFEAAWNREHFGPLEEILATEFSFHMGGQTRTMNVADLREIIARWRTAFPDLRFDMHAVIADGDRAAAHATLNGTHEGIWSDLDATGRSIHVEHMFFFRFDHERIVEVWELLDRPALQRQISED